MARHLADERPGGPAGTGPFRPLRLVVQRGPDAGRSFVVGKAGATLGRGDENTVALSDPAVSRCHAAVAAQGDDLVVRDRGSLHGTWLNGRRLAAPQPLRPGDALELGDTLLGVDLAFGTGALLPTGAPAAATAVYRSEWHARGASVEPVYELRGGLLYRRRWHERGASQEPDYELHGALLYRTAHHPLGAGQQPDYELRAGQLYRTRWHPEGAAPMPEYRLEAPGVPGATAPMRRRR